jgi:alkaline phosphatase D
MTRPPRSIPFLAVLLAGVVAIPAVDAGIDSVSATEVVETSGPVLGDLTATSVRIACRRAEPGVVVIGLADSSGTPVRRCLLACPAETDGAGILEIVDLEPATRYLYTVDGASNDSWWFETRPVPDARCRIVFGSCADEKAGSSTVWRRIEADDPSALVLLGDTPYIDTTDLVRQRSRYRDFAGVPAFADLVAHVPLYSTWDDHDFGRNDTDGNLAGKENSRRAVMEHRPNPSLGEAGEGIYTSFRQGPVEVFLLDARWFARTEGESDDPTLLGRRQWAWLERSLAASTAPFRILACGMVFNGSVRPFKTDCWGAYPKEYDRLVELIGRVGDAGVVLVSGDVHWSRVIRHDTGDRLDHDLMEFVTSPIHEKLIAAANPPHPGLVFSVGEINSFLVVDAAVEGGTASMSLRIRNASGEDLHTTRVERSPADA